MRVFMADRGSRPPVVSVIYLLIFSAAPPCRAHPQLAMGRVGGRLINPWVEIKFPFFDFDSENG